MSLGGGIQRLAHAGSHLIAAIGFFTRIPVPARWLTSAVGLNHAAPWLPLVGVLIGALAALVALAALQVWPQPVAVLLAMAVGVQLTGAFHEDGLADTADGLGGGWDKARILEIMKDSRLGSFGAVALWFALAGRFVLLNALPPALLPLALVAGHSLSRACALLPMVLLDYARSDDSTKARPVAVRLGWLGLAFAALPAGLCCLLLPPLAAVAGAVGALLATGWLTAKMARWLGGYTGDCLGAVQQLAELAFYLGVLAVVGAAAGSLAAPMVNVVVAGSAA